VTAQAICQQSQQSNKQNLKKWKAEGFKVSLSDENWRISKNVVFGSKIENRKCEIAWCKKGCQVKKATRKVRMNEWMKI
jgi:hypothetical protein